MELPKIGRQCSEPNCKQLDFLPLKCNCGKEYCSEHFNVHILLCKKSKQLSDTELKKITDVYKCSHPECNVTDVIPLICDKCNQHFCIKHRHIINCEVKDPSIIAAEKERYAKPIREFELAKAAVDKQVEKNLNDVKKKEKNRHLANKVQLMKIKNKATGLKSIPIPDRVYFNVQYPQSFGVKMSPVFVSKSWSLGRVIDAIASECNIENRNNKAGEKKLRLFRKDTGEILSQNVSDTIEFLFKNAIILDGENLIMEYVDDTCFQVV